MAKCSSIVCGKLQPSKERPVVWTVDGKPFCNTCFLNYVDKNPIIRQDIVRLFDDEDLYVDIRTQKRRRRVSQPNPCGPPMQLRA